MKLINASHNQDLYTVGLALNREGSELNQLRIDLQEAKDQRFHAVNDALSKLATSHEHAVSLDGSWDSVGQAAGQASGMAGSSDSDIQEIASDAPGKDVSSSGRAVEYTVRDIQYKIEDMESALSNSSYTSSNGQRDLQDAISLLQSSLY